jgi:predicted nucleic acid-binding protein
MRKVCVDASFALKLVLDEPGSAKVSEYWSDWIDSDVEIVAPYHLVFEVISVIRNQVYRGNISGASGELAYTTFLAQDVRIYAVDELHQRAWNFAVQLNRPTVYDTYYLALGDYLDCDVWTADRRLYHAAKGELSRLHLLN